MPAIISIEKALKETDLNRGVEGFFYYITDTTLISLKFCSIFLDKKNKYNNLDEENLKEISSIIDEVIEEVIQYEFNETLKIFIMEKLNCIKEAIDDYKNYGIDKLKESIGDGLGSLILNVDLAEEMNKDSGVKNIVGNIIKSIGQINQVITFAKNVSPVVFSLSEGINKFIQ